MAEANTLHIEKVPLIWLVTAVCGVPFAIYYLLSFLSPLIHRLTPLTISEIYIYPIKSLRAVKVTEAVATRHGFQHDRTFMLVQKTKDGYTNMAVSAQPEMTQFLQEISTDQKTLTIKYLAAGDTSKQSSLSIPLEPETSDLAPTEITMHSSPTPAFIMPQKYSDWFSTCFGYPTSLIYLGPSNTRDVKFADMQPVPPNPLTNFLYTHLPSLKPYITSIMGMPQTSPWEITFADCAPFLVASQTSLDDVSARLPQDMTMDITKFRPNIVLKGALAPFQEDYWGKITLGNGMQVLLTHNCVRCKSINIDYETGKPGEGGKGEVLKRLQKDRRVDVGAKWSPVFGRYGFWNAEVGEKKVIRAGERVDVTKVNEGLTVWNWPGLA